MTLQRPPKKSIKSIEEERQSDKHTLNELCFFRAHENLLKIWGSSFKTNIIKTVVAFVVWKKNTNNIQEKTRPYLTNFVN